MTVSLIVNGQEIECESPKEAAKLMKQAAKREAAEQKKRNADYNLAIMRARAAAFELVTRANQPNSTPRWAIFRADGSDYQKSGHARIVVNKNICYRNETVLTISTEHGNASHAMGSVYSAVALENGAGWVEAVRVNDDSLSGQSAEWLVFGVSNDVYSYVHIDGALALTIDAMVAKMEASRAAV